MELDEIKYLHKLITHASLDFEESKAIMHKFLSGDFNPRLASSILSIISFKGEMPEELAGFSVALTDQMKKFNSPYEDLIDIVGTGGDKKQAFNISTVSSIVLSILGVRIAKQARMSRSSGCASGDILCHLGVNINADYEKKKLCLDQENIVILNNKDYYGVLEPIKEIEHELGFQTIISSLPVLCHPAKVRKMIIGTPDRLRASLIAKALEIVGIDKAYVLWNEAGYDEIVPIGVTRVLIVENSKLKKEISLTANDFALAGNYKIGTPITGGSLEMNIHALNDANNLEPGIILDTIIMNTVLGLKLAGSISSLKDGTELVKSKLKKGDIMTKIKKIIQITN